MSWIVSLGAGREQIPLIRSIQAEGFKCLAFDLNPDSEGVNCVDRFYNISNRNIIGMMQALEFETDIAGVMAAGTEVPDVMAILAHRLGVPGVPVATGMLIKDKLRYKEVLKAAGVPHTEAYEFYGGGAKVLFDKLKYEVVVKPRSGSGSRGVFLNRHDPMGLMAQLAEAAEADHSWLIMERYQPGPQISAEHIIWAGEAYCVAFVDRFYEEFGKELGGSSPSEWKREVKAANALIASAARALGIVNGTIKSDLVLTENGPKLIELTCRLSGGPLSAIVKQSTGVDYLRQAVRVALGKEPEWESMIPSKTESVAVDMHGNKMDWEWSRKYVVKELGKCVLAT